MRGARGCLRIALSSVQAVPAETANRADTNRMKTITKIAIALPLLVSGVAMAADMPKLAKDNGCQWCHVIEAGKEATVGPVWKEVAKKYRGQPDAEAKLIAKVSKGGGGVWGKMPMPPNSPNVKDEDIKALVRYILRLK